MADGLGEAEKDDHVVGVVVEAPRVMVIRPLALVHLVGANAVHVERHGRVLPVHGERVVAARVYQIRVHPARRVKAAPAQAAILLDDEVVCDGAGLVAALALQHVYLAGVAVRVAACCFVGAAWRHQRRQEHEADARAAHGVEQLAADLEYAVLERSLAAQLGRRVLVAFAVVADDNSGVARIVDLARLDHQLAVAGAAGAAARSAVHALIVGEHFALSGR